MNLHTTYNKIQDLYSKGIHNFAQVQEMLEKEGIKNLSYRKFKNAIKAVKVRPQLTSDDVKQIQKTKESTHNLQILHKKFPNFSYNQLKNPQDYDSESPSPRITGIVSICEDNWDLQQPEEDVIREVAIAFPGFVTLENSS